jgi:hypothetical protein
MELQVASNLAFFGTFGARVSGCPVPQLSAAPPDAAASCPARCTFGLCRRRSLELPRVSHPSALPSLKPRVAPKPCFRLCLPMSRQVTPASASSGLAGDGSSSYPESRILQRFQHSSSELPRSFASLVAPADESPGLPGSCIFRLCRRRNLRVAPNLPSFGASGAGALGFPSALLIQMRLLVWLRVAPRPAPSGFASVPSFRVAPNPLSLGAG